MGRSKSENKFIEQSHKFVECALQYYGFSSLEAACEIAIPEPSQIEAIVVDNYNSLSRDERLTITNTYTEEGIVILRPAKPPAPVQPHMLFRVVEQLKSSVPLNHPLKHPLEGHHEAIARFGEPDGTVKIYNLPIEPNGARYREQAETNEPFLMHHDGLGAAGTVEAVVLYCDNHAEAGGITYFQNIVMCGLRLAKEDWAAFESLFLPDTMAVTRPRGKGAIRVSSPVFFVNQQNRAQSVFRMSSGEYQVQFRNDNDVTRAVAAIRDACSGPQQGSRFTVLRRGDMCIFRNTDIAHARTEFVDGDAQRVLSRKWFMTSDSNSVYKHVPGMAIKEEYSEIFPGRFSGEALRGEWLLDQSTGENIRIR